jgi:hypothetical protein
MDILANKTKPIAIGIYMIFMLLSYVFAQVCDPNHTYEIMLCVSMMYAFILLHLVALVCKHAYARLEQYDRKSKWFMTKTKKVHKKFTGIVTVLTLGLAALALWRMYKRYDTDATEVQGGDSESEIAKKVEKENVYITPVKQIIPVNHEGTITTIQMSNNIMSNLAGFMILSDNDGNETSNFCNALCIKSQIWMVPTHMLPAKIKTTLKIQLVQNSHAKPCNNPTSLISEIDVHRIKGLDATLIKIPSSNNKMNIMKYFPDVIPTQAVVSTFTLKRPTGLRNEVKIPIFEEHREVVRTNVMQETESIQRAWKRGGITARTDNLFECIPENQEPGKGFCMGVYIANERKPYIRGVHIAGQGRKSIGYCITMPQLNDAVLELETNHFIGRGSEETPIPTSAYGVDLDLQGASQKSIVSWLTPDDPVNFDWYGDFPEDRRTYRSNVQKTPISEAVTKHMGVPPQHGKPFHMNSWKHPRLPMINSASMCHEIDTSILQCSYRYTLEHFIKGLCRIKWDYVRPLEFQQAIDGTDEFGIDPMKMNTSAGFPLNRPKSEFFDIQEIENGVTRIPCKEIVDQYNVYLELLKEGKDPKFFFRGNLKDEAVKIGKEKVRVFYGIDVAALMLERKYFTSLCKLMMENPLIFGCSVGQDAFSKDWTKLTDYMLTYGEDRVFAGDYKTYDSKMSSTFIRTAFKILIDIAEESGNYSEEDLFVMQGIANAISQNYVVLDGCLIHNNGVNPSGHALTVIINDIVNKLYLDYAYRLTHSNRCPKDIYSSFWHPLPPLESLGPFLDEVVTVITQGDDNKGSINPKYPRYNHTTIQKALRTIGVEYTMADKTSESIPLIHNDDCDFLKRKSVWCDKFKCWLAPLCEESIFKPLHHIMKSEVYPMEICGQVVNQQLREWFFHGEEKFNERRSQLEKVVEETGLRPYLDNSRLFTYEELVEWFLPRLE